MAQGENAAKRWGKELWAKRHGNPQEPGRDAKRQTHRYERHVESKEQIKEQLDG